MNLSNYKNDCKEDLEFKEEQQKNIIKCKYSKVCAISFYSLCMSGSSAYIYIYSKSSRKATNVPNYGAIFQTHFLSRITYIWCLR